MKGKTAMSDAARGRLGIAEPKEVADPCIQALRFCDSRACATGCPARRMAF